MSVFITKGMKVSMSLGSLGFSPDGVPGSSIQLQVGLVMYPVWLEIALDHLLKSRNSRESLAISISAREPDARKAAHLEREFVHGMQSIASSAFALDSFYAELKPFAKFTRDELEAMRQNRSSRPDRIKETLRRVFRLNAVNTAEIGGILSAAYKFRDWSVHPPANQSDPILHPELKAGVEWRFMAFSSGNAKEVLRSALVLLSAMCKKGAEGEESLKLHCTQVANALAPVLESWTKDFGPISAAPKKL